MRELTLQDAEDEGAIELYSPPRREPRVVRIHNGKKFRFFDLSAQSARQLRDWLDEWLGDTTESTYTDDDVKRLVKEVRESMQNGSLNIHLHAPYNDVLAPFQTPDLDAGLIEEMAAAAYESDHNGDGWYGASPKVHDQYRASQRRALSIVRKHDARKSGTPSPSH